jgi:PASTA domain
MEVMGVQAGRGGCTVVENVPHHRVLTRALAMAATALSVAALVVAFLSIDRHSASRSTPSPTSIESATTITVPMLVGMNTADATASAERLGLSVRTVQTQSTVAPRGAVIAQEPPAGTSIRKGDPVTLTTPSGP